MKYSPDGRQHRRMSMMSSAPIDDDQRRQALDPTRSFIVQAPAGSGKTELLIQRYLRLLARVGEPEEIVAITFTRKAAAEMRSRVLKALREAEVGSEPRNAHQQCTRELALTALGQDRSRRWVLKDNPARLRIQTIDSLCARVIRQMPWLTGFGGQLEPVDDADALYRMAAHSLLAELEGQRPWSKPLAALLRHLDNNLGIIEDLLAGILARRDQWLRHVVGRKGQAACREELEKGLQNVICDALQDLVSMFPAELESELLKLARYAARNLRQSGIESAILACDGLGPLPSATLGDLAAWRGIADLLLTGRGEWRSRCDRGIGFPARGDSKAETDRCKEYKDAFIALIAACQETNHLRNCLVALRNLPEPNYSEGQWQIMQALFELLPMAVAHLELIFQERGQVDFSGVARRALDALGPEDQPTDLALMLDYRIRHILIDEFQDTSHSQSHLLQGLIASWTEGDGRTLFAVGDPMQSIYGFREAEVGVFLRVRNQGLGSIRPVPLTLSANFRSQAGIVSWINAAFPQVFPAVEDISAGAVVYTPCEATNVRIDGEAVQVHCYTDKGEAAEAERIVELVSQARDQEPEGTIAILVRGKNHLTAITPRLNAAGLRFRAVDIEQLGERPLVRDLLALTRALSHPADRLCWLAVLRAPWCGLTLNDLYALAGDDLQSPLWDLISDDARCQPLSPDGQCRLARVRHVLGGCLAERRSRSLRRQVEGAWLALGGPATATRRADLEDAQRYFELLERLDDGGELTDFAALEAGVEGLHAASDTHADMRLQIMTIHKAKGLEFDTVIVPGLGRTTGRDKGQLLTWLERTTRGGKTDLLIAAIAATAKREKDPSYTSIRRLIDVKIQHENERLLYVAATRARKRLHLLGHATPNKNGGCKAATRSLLAALWPAVEKDFAKAANGWDKAPAVNAPKIPAESRLRRFCARWRLPLPSAGVTVTNLQQPIHAEDAAAFDVEFAWAGPSARHVGVVAHRLLQRIAREEIEQWNQARLEGLRQVNIAALAALGVPRDELNDAADRVEQALLSTLGSNRGRWLFDAAHSEVRAEYALTGRVEGRLINIKIDRTFVDSNGVRWIIDYKMGTHEGTDIEAFLKREEERYRPQLERYAALMRLKEFRPIKAGLYYPLIAGGWREWVTG